MAGKRILSLALAGLLSACAGSPSGVTVLNGPMSDGKPHREPVFFNGKIYNVSYRFDMGRMVYALKVTGQDRFLKASPANAQAATQLGLSSLSHFACPTRHPARMLPGTLAHDGEGYVLEARCGA